MKSKIIIFAALVAATLVGAQAANLPSEALSYSGASLQCVPHKGLLGTDGMDCRLTGAPGVGATTLQTTDLAVWCNGATFADTTACKGVGKAQLQNGLTGGFPAGTRMRIALDCVSPAASAGPMQCKEVVEIGRVSDN